MFRKIIFSVLFFHLIFFNPTSYAEEAITKVPEYKDKKVQIYHHFPILHNKAGYDGLGLCVFTSIENTAIPQAIYPLYGLRDWMVRKQGGGWPEKVDRILREYKANVKYVHFEGSSVDKYEKVFRDALDVGFVPCITWGTDVSHYGGRQIAHMINVVYWDDDYVCVVDNNFPREYLWVDTPTAKKYMSLGGFWGMIFYDQPAILLHRVRPTYEDNFTFVDTHKNNFGLDRSKLKLDDHVRGGKWGDDVELLRTINEIKNKLMIVCIGKTNLKNDPDFKDFVVHHRDKMEDWMRDFVGEGLYFIQGNQVFGPFPDKDSLLNKLKPKPKSPVIVFDKELILIIVNIIIIILFTYFIFFRQK